MREPPSHLLYLLMVGKEKELVLQIHGDAPTGDEILSWMKNGTVVPLTVSSQGEAETFVLLVSFRHVVAARVAPHSATRSASF